MSRIEREQMGEDAVMIGGFLDSPEIQKVYTGCSEILRPDYDMSLARSSACIDGVRRIEYAMDVYRDGGDRDEAGRRIFRWVEKRRPTATDPVMPTIGGRVFKEMLREAMR
jgi:hypothetical protein